MIPQRFKKIKHNQFSNRIFWRERVMLMPKETICCVCRTDAVRYAAKYLAERRFQVTESPGPDVTHLLLPVPSFSQGDDYLSSILSQLPEDVIVCGGNLDIPLLKNYWTVDLLQDSYYLADNAAITAECAIRIMEENTDLSGCPVLVLGWGRIGKCLGQQLRDKGADISIAARKEEDLALIHALGFKPVQIRTVDKDLTQYRVILNTIPAMVFPEMVTAPDATILELASKPGMQGEHIISARGLPGKMAPEASGKLICDTFIRLLL